MPVVRLVVTRLLLAIPLLFVVSALTFVLVALTPGDPTRRMGTNTRGLSAAKGKAATLVAEGIGTTKSVTFVRAHSWRTVMTADPGRTVAGI